MYELQIYEPGVDPAVSGPSQRFPVPPASVSCDRPVVVSAPIAVNPTTIAWTDPDRPNRLCVADAGSFLLQLPFRSGAYLATLTVTVNGVTSARSAPSNIFLRPQPFRSGI
jgi:hypothetical protein